MSNFVDGDLLNFRGQIYPLLITQNENQPSGCAIIDDQLFVNLTSAELSPRAKKEETQLELMLWYKKEARRALQARTDYWSAQLGVRYRRMAISNPRRRWGSCNYRNDIRLNWRLIMLEPELMDYVVAHELCHVTHKNHSRRFWDHLSTIMPDYYERRQRLRVWEKSNIF